MSGSDAADRGAANRAEGLLEQIADTALDDDYYVVRPGSYRQTREFNTVLTGLVLGVFALLVSIAAIQTRTDRPSTERERETLIQDIAAREGLLASRESTATELRREVDRLSSAVNRFDPAYEELRLIASDVPARGPGVRVEVSPSEDGLVDGQIRDADLRVLVNGLWYAGAEAVAVNGNRIGSLSAIRSAEGVIKVNYRGVAPPYVVEAIGDAEALMDRFEQNPAGRYWEQRHQDAGVGYDVARSSQLEFRAVPDKRLAIRHAKAIEEEE